MQVCRYHKPRSQKLILIVNIYPTSIPGSHLLCSTAAFPTIGKSFPHPTGLFALLGPKGRLSFPSPVPSASLPQDVSVQLRQGRAQHFCRGMGGGNFNQMREILFGLEGIKVENLSNFPKISYLISLASPFMCRAKLLGGPHPSPESCASH